MVAQGWMSILVVVVALGLGSAQAQVDNDPTNDTPGGADALVLGPGESLVNLAALGEPDNDVDYFSFALNQEDALIGMITSVADLPVDFDAPDVIIKVSNSIPLIFNDDSGSRTNTPGGSSHGGVFRLLAPNTETFQIGITGFNDSEFDGKTSGEGHNKIGQYALSAARFDPNTPGGDFSDTAANQTRAGADPIGITANQAAVAVGSLAVDGTDVDFFELNLKQGDVLSALTAPLKELPNSFDRPDTLIGLFDSNGTMFALGDDAGKDNEGDIPELEGLSSDFPHVEKNYGSGIHVVIVADGKYYLGLTGTGDRDFDGLLDNSGTPHDKFGDYALLVSVVDMIPLSVLGDFNNDSLVNNDDIDLMRNAIGAMISDHIYNVDLLNGDTPTEADFDFLISEIIGSDRGDGDLNKVINFADFALLANNFGRSGTLWNEGNFNLDDVTNFEDFAELSTRFGMAFPSDEQAVPEPALLTLVYLAIGGQTMLSRWNSFTR